MFSYDAATGNVSGISDGETETRYYYGMNKIAAQNENGRISRYLEDGKGRILCEIRPEGELCLCIYGSSGLLAQVYEGKIYYMLRDYQSSVRAVWDGEKLCAAWHYDAFGNCMGGAFETEEIRDLLPVRFTGHLLTGQGLYRMGRRWYDPVSGHFLSIDPKHQYSSPYLYGNCDWINYYDPDGAFSVGNFFASLLTITVGVVCVGVGIALTVASGGMAAPLAAVLTGAALSGFGFGAGIYGIVSLCTNEYNIWDCLISGVGGAVTGALTAGIGAALPSLTGWTATLVDFTVGFAIGAADGVVTNGCINVVHGRDFTEDWVQNMVIGGVLGGVFGALSGVGRAYQNQKLISINNYDSEIHIHYTPSRRSSGFGHASLGIIQHGHRIGTELLVRAKEGAGTYLGGQTRVRVYRTAWEYNKEILRSFERPVKTARVRISRNIRGRINPVEIGNNGPYCHLFNDCTSYVANMLGKGGFGVPLWARTPYTMYIWGTLLR